MLDVVPKCHSVLQLSGWKVLALLKLKVVTINHSDDKENKHTCFVPSGAHDTAHFIFRFLRKLSCITTAPLSQTNNITHLTANHSNFTPSPDITVLPTTTNTALWLYIAAVGRKPCISPCLSIFQFLS